MKLGYWQNLQTLLVCQSPDRLLMTRRCSHIQVSYSASVCLVLPTGRGASLLPDTCSAGHVCQPPGHSPCCVACSPAGGQTAHHLSLPIALPALFVMRQPAQDKWVQSTASQSSTCACAISILEAPVQYSAPALVTGGWQAHCLCGRLSRSPLRCPCQWLPQALASHTVCPCHWLPQALAKHTVCPCQWLPQALASHTVCPRPLPVASLLIDLCADQAVHGITLLLKRSALHDLPTLAPACLQVVSRLLRKFLMHAAGCQQTHHCAAHARLLQPELNSCLPAGGRPVR